ncbi:MAG: hypothetical protein ACFFCQ_03595 [Promethearchaeota archaeon]
MEISIEQAGIIGIATFIATLTTFLIMRPIIQWLKDHGLTGIDVHKLNKPSIPERGGIGIIIGLLLATSMETILLPEWRGQLIAFSAVVIMGLLIGIYDDQYRIGALTKPILLLSAGMPIIVLDLFYELYDGRPRLPFIGAARLTLVYPLLILIAISVTSNAVNMADTLNGSMPNICIIATCAICISGIILDSIVSLIIGLPLLGALIGYWYYNKHPSKVFSGDTGSLAVGASIGALAVLGKLETVAIIAIMPLILNSYSILFSLGRLMEKSEIKTRPIFLREDGRLCASTEKAAPITLIRTILAYGPLFEYEIVRVMSIIALISGILALITAFTI